MSTTSRGNAFENEIAAQLEARGALCGIRRHRKGGGDVLALWASIPAWFVECKTTKRGPLADFGPDDRRALVNTAKKFRAKPLLVWKYPPSAEPQWFDVTYEGIK